jgi:predicted DNA binding protein
MISNESGVIHYLVEVKLEGASSSVLSDVINDIDGIEVVNTSDISENKYILTVSVDECDICQAILGSGCFLKTAWSNKDRIIWNFVAPKKEFVKIIVDSLEDLNINYQLSKLHTMDEREVLTKKQEQILKIALEKGYFDFPKRCGIREISRETNISTASISTTIRRATKRLVEQHFISEDVCK